MELFSLAAFAITLIFGTVAIHSVATFFMIRVTRKISGHPGYARITAGAASRVLVLLLTHMLEIALWAVLYYKQDFFPDFHTSLYFSLHAAIGWGDVMLKEQYRMLGGIQALVGVLMISWSTALLVGFLQRVYSPFIDGSKDPDRPP